MLPTPSIDFRSGQLNVDHAFNNVANQGRIARYPRYTDPRQITLPNFFRF